LVLAPEALPLLLATAVFSLIATLALAYLSAHEERVRGLRTITAAYAFNTLRLCAFPSGPLIGEPLALLITNLGNTATAVLLIGGALRMAEARPRPRLLAAVMLAGAVLAAWAAYGGMPLALRAFFFTGVSALGQFFLAWALFRQATRASYAGFRVAAVLSALQGVLRASAGLWPMSAGSQMAGIAVAGTLYMATGIALILALQRAQYLEAREARRRTEGAQNLAQLAFESTTDLMSLLRVEPGPRFVSEMVNPSFIAYWRAAYLGREPASYLGRDIAEAMRQDIGIAEAQVREILHPYEEAVRTGEPQQSLMRHGEREREAVYTPIKDAAGRVTHILYRGTDITERRRAERELRRSAEQFRTMLDQAPVAVVITSQSDGRYRYVNPEWTRQSGYEPAEALGRTARDLGFWSGDAERRDHLLAALERDGKVQIEHAYRSKSGRRIEIVMAAQKVTHEGEPCILATTVDVTEIVESRRRAGEMTERLATIFKVSPVPLLVTALADGRVLEVNETWLRLEGRRREDVVGRTSVELGLWTDAAERDRLYAELASQGRVRDFFSHFRRLDGTVIDAIVHAEPLEWEGVPALLASSQDVTALESARSEAQQAHQRVAAILESLPVAISIVSFGEGRFRYVNPKWCSQTGIAREQALGRTSLELGLWQDSGTRQERVLRPLESGGSTQYEHSYVNRRGRRAHVMVSAMALEFEGERCVLSASLDVTEETESRRRAGEMAERFARVFNLSPVPLLVSTLAEGRFLEVNDAWVAMHRRARESVIGHTAAELGAWADPADRARLVERLRAGERVRGFLTRFRTADGQVLDSICAAEAVDWNGERAILASTQDVSELTRAAAEIRRLNESLEERVGARTAELEQALAELESFSYSVSHDLRAPLRAMSSFATLLAQKPALAADRQAVDYAERITRAASHMGRVVDELLHYSRLARQPVAMRPVALAEEVAALVKELGEQNPGRRIAWRVAPLPTVSGDPTLLRLVLQNLLDNAVKYTRLREDAAIEVSARELDQEVEVRVTDNGAGFDMAHAEKLFRPFQRLHHDSEFEGTGIGLAHARRIIERHQGRIGAESAPGKGATFWFTLPR
jgi:PAS domain S-box-containing protein